MPKTIELTIEIDVQKVSCPGVWLCQDGRVSLTVFALGTSYQTCLLPPVFPLAFRDVFYFRKRFQESCALNNICCLLKDETIYCELVQWSDNCLSGECVMLAQYLGAVNDVLFPPNMCSTDGVDLLMRRTTDFPGILSPKIEIATKVRIDEIWNQHSNKFDSVKAKTCQCNPRQDLEGSRHKQVCHSAQYHRTKCNQGKPKRTDPRPRSRSRSGGSRSCCSLEQDQHVSCRCPNPLPKPRMSRECSAPARRSRPCQYKVYSVETPAAPWCARSDARSSCSDDDKRTNLETPNSTPNEERYQKLLLESRYIENNKHSMEEPSRNTWKYTKVTPCVCEICRRYHEIFHADDGDSCYARPS